MPPSQVVLKNKIERTNYLSRLLKNSTLNNVDIDDPGQHGWIIEEDQFVIDFFNGPQYPEFFIDNCDATDDIAIQNMDEEDNIVDINLFSTDDEDDLYDE
jgi:hypothetical protein